VLSDLKGLISSVLGNSEIIIDLNTKAKDIKGWDSLNHIKLIVAVEKFYGVRFNASEISGLENIGQFAQVIVEKI
jgi:acyl carrier protein